MTFYIFRPSTASLRSIIIDLGKPQLYSARLHRTKASTLETTQSVGSESSTGGVLLRQSDIALVRLIAGCALPPNILDDPRFRTVIEVLRRDRFYKLPSRRTFLRDNGPLHKMARHLADVGSKKAATALVISVTFDIWSKLSFTGIGITRHLITPAFRRDQKL